jgi:hypothetical protein
MTMRCSIWLATLAVVSLAAGGCKQQEPTPPAPQPAPIVASQQEQSAKELPLPAVVETVPAAPAPPAPVKAAPIETTKAAPTVTVQSAPAVVVPVTPAEKPAAAPTPAAQTVIYKASNGNVIFDHLQHAGNNTCSSCHPSEPPARIDLDKDKAHQLCKGCHQQTGSGPTQCTGCHKKG